MRILYVDCDTLRPDHLGCYGYERPTSPTVDAVAAEGMRFDSCYITDGPCLPSRTALFSGRLGVRTGVVGHAGRTARIHYPGDGHATDPRRRPLPLVLSLADVHSATISTFGQRHLAWYFYSGWDEVQRFSNKNGHEIATEVEAAALEWLDRNAKRDDWFLHVHYWDPHTPYRTPDEYGNPFEDMPAPPFPTEETLAAQQEMWGPAGARDRFDLAPGTSRTPEQMRTRDDFKTWIDGYDTGIRFFDDSLARLLDRLASLGVLDDTAVVISSDHGENHGELNLYGSHATADAITCHIPLIVRWPGAARGARSELVHHLDLAPTVCDMLGLEAPADWDGQSLAPALRGEPFAGRPHLVFGQSIYYVQRGIVADGHLYVRTLYPALDPMPSEMLFDLANDPHEQHDLSASRPDIAGRMARLLTDWWGELAPDVGSDPILGAIDEGGGYYVRVIRELYLDHLRKTGREDVADLLERRRIDPVVDQWDLSRH